MIHSRQTIQSFEAEEDIQSNTRQFGIKNNVQFFQLLPSLWHARSLVVRDERLQGVGGAEGQLSVQLLYPWATHQSLNQQSTYTNLYTNAPKTKRFLT